MPIKKKNKTIIAVYAIFIGAIYIAILLYFFHFYGTVTISLLSATTYLLPDRFISSNTARFPDDLKSYDYFQMDLISQTFTFASVLLFRQNTPFLPLL